MVKKERSRAAVLSDVQNAVAELDMTKYRTAAVLCRNEEEALFVYDSLKKDLPVTLIKETTTVYCEGILVMSAYFAKGLEFDAVVVCDMGREAKIRSRDRNFTLHVQERCMSFLFSTREALMRISNN